MAGNQYQGKIREMIYFSSDWHLDHEKIIKLTNRPFKDLIEMNNTILERYKDDVKPGDTFYFLGDLGWSHATIEGFFINYHNPKVPFHWVIGNHDKKYIAHFKQRVLPRVKNVFLHEGLLDVEVMHKEEKYVMTLCHYPMITWNRSHFGAWQLYGHHHTDYSGEFKYLRENAKCMGKQVNVSCDLWNYYPVSIDQVIDSMENLPNNWDLIYNRT